MSHRLLVPLARHTLATSASTHSFASALSASRVLQMRKKFFSTSAEPTEKTESTDTSEAAQFAQQWKGQFEDIRAGLKEKWENNCKFGLEQAEQSYQKEEKIEKILEKYRGNDHSERVSLFHAGLMRGSYVFSVAYCGSALGLMTVAFFMSKLGLPPHELLHVELRQPAQDFNDLFNSIETVIQLWPYRLLFSTVYTGVSMRRWIEDNASALSGGRSRLNLQPKSA